MAKKTTKKTSKTTAKKAAKNRFSGWLLAPREASTMNDVKTAILLVSLALNVAIFIGWLILKTTTIYDEQVYSFLFNR